MKKSVIVISYILLLQLSLEAETLKECVVDVLATNPKVVESLKHFNYTREDVTIAKSGYLPKIDLTSSLADGSFDGLSSDYKKDNIQSYQYSLKLTQNIFNGFATRHSTNAEEAKTTASAYSYIETTNDVAFNMSKVYIDVLQYKELLEIAYENIEISTNISAKVEKLFNAGHITLSEVNKVNASLELSKSNYVVIQNNLLDAKHSLHRVLGRYIDEKSMVIPFIDLKMPSSKDEIIALALKHSPTLIVSSYNIKMFQSLYKERKSFYYPKLDLDVTQSAVKTSATYRGDSNEFTAKLNLSFNFFNGLEDSAKLQQAISQVQKEISAQDDLKRQVIEQISLAHTSHMKLQEKMKHLLKYKEYSFLTLDLYTKEYDLGRRSLLDLLTAQNDLISAKKQIAEGNFEILYSKYKILDAIGMLVIEVLKEENPSLANVGLSKTKNNITDDTISINNDYDNDKILNNIDISSNSKKDDKINSYGYIETNIDHALPDRVKYENFVSTKEEEEDLSEEDEEAFSEDSAFEDDTINEEEEKEEEILIEDENTIDEEETLKEETPIVAPAQESKQTAFDDEMLRPEPSIEELSLQHRNGAVTPSFVEDIIAAPIKAVAAVVAAKEIAIPTQTLKVKEAKEELEIAKSEEVVEKENLDQKIVETEELLDTEDIIEEKKELNAAIYMGTYSNKANALKSLSKNKTALNLDNLEIVEDNGVFSMISRVDGNENNSKVLANIRKIFPDAWLLKNAPVQKTMVSKVPDTKTEEPKIEIEEEVTTQKDELDEATQLGDVIYLGTYSNKEYAINTLLENSKKYNFNNLEIVEDKGIYSIVTRVKESENSFKLLKDLKSKFPDAWLLQR
ncbi:MAG: TolC family outer membrane protein [Helicobacteraceae bacterium]|nr:TolC family outer membrane protein [Helicobacteraceae bacterium]